MKKKILRWGNRNCIEGISLSRPYFLLFTFFFRFSLRIFLFFWEWGKRLGRSWHRHRTDFFDVAGKSILLNFHSFPSTATLQIDFVQQVVDALFFSPCFSCDGNWTINVQCLFNCALFYAHLTLFALTC